MAGSDCSRPLTPGHVLHYIHATQSHLDNGLSRLAGRQHWVSSIIGKCGNLKLKYYHLPSILFFFPPCPRPLTFASRRLAIRSHDDDDDSRSQSTNLKSCQVQSKFLASKDSFHPLYMSLLPGGGPGTRQSFISSFSLSRSDHVLFEYIEFL